MAKYAASLDEWREKAGPMVNGHAESDSPREPSEARRREIEARLAEVRAEKLASEAAKGRVPLTDPKDMPITSANPNRCPTCGGEMKRIGAGRGYLRCFACHSKRKGSAGAKPAKVRMERPRVAEAIEVPSPVVVAMLAPVDNDGDVLAELDAMREIAGALAPLDAPARGRVLAWIAGRFGG